jgi:hypothetical protein
VSANPATAMTAEQVVEALASLRTALLEDSDRREKQWDADRKETEQRHKAEVARVQHNADETRGLHIRSVVASERLAAAMESIARSLISTPTGDTGEGEPK